ncbi:proto-oncogene tyrosine-protein kinase ROS [Caerostris extrusa]|uniref:receptor protein-tyrosine kinase n=1 Tax=Caerostris extrusa TaxID=172846 RepID=A0AAV4PND3_CAEEX|nr:proto-oncogene tyrosine-protein kinase ROS [Caerostris extrusa]
MAPESLLLGFFTTQSDIWAFGVLLWEVITLGVQPYPARNNMEVFHFVKSGGHLEKPENCPDDLYQIMVGCWKYDADSRPCFRYCLQGLQELRARLASSSLAIPAVCNFHYFAQQNAGTYIGRYDPRDEEDENKLLDPHFDSRSVRSDPPTLSEMLITANPSSMRRSMSWTNTLRWSPDGHPPCAARPAAHANTTLVKNKYLELLGDNEDSDGYQLPLAALKATQSSAQTPARRCDLDSVTSSSNVIKQSLSLNHLPLIGEDKTEQRSSVVDELDLMLTSSQRNRSISGSSTAHSEHSWLEDCDNWSFSTASTATCPLDASPSETTLSPVAGVDIHHSSTSSYC